jgi:hypothetical protein
VDSYPQDIYDDNPGRHSRLQVLTMKIILLLPIVFATGCSSFQASNYVNRNTPYGNHIEATGRAADLAASANRSNNCPSCTQSGSTQSGTDQQASNNHEYRDEQNIMQVITRSAIHTLNTEIQNEINDAIRKAFD